MRVFHREHAGRPVRVVWTLEELGQPYELTVLTGDGGRSEEHRARHPLGRVPVLEDDEGFVFESAAICLHLADMHPGRASCRRWEPTTGRSSTNGRVSPRPSLSRR
jgi:glutathione S-transferase